MKAIAINGSPRKGGNTELLLRRVLTQLDNAGWQTEYKHIGGSTIRGCQACYKCFEKKDGHCVMGKDPFNECFDAMRQADAVILGSPTYFTDVTAEMKALLDRAGLVSLANGCLLAGKIGAAVVAVRRGGGTHVYDTINHMFQMSSMIVPGSTYWNLGFGREKGEVAGDAEGLRNMDNLGRTIAWLGKAIAASAEPFPTPDLGR